MANFSRRIDDRPIAPPKPAPITVDSFLMLLDDELKVARGLDQSSIFYEGRRDDAVQRIAHYFERAKRSPLTPVRKALGLSTNQMVLPRLEETNVRIIASVEEGKVPNLTARQWLIGETAPEPDAPEADAPEADSADE